MCMAADADQALALQAVSSTASGLRAGDGIFLHIDGATKINEASFRAACRSVPIVFHYSAKRMGLAAGLNKLLDDVLAEPTWTYLARMDADDVCLPLRFERQRKFLDENFMVDILGAQCREVDESGRHLRTKSLPRHHEAIASHLPKRNPINHPTVIMRRTVLESGIRYRTDVGLVEDWYLWIDAAAKGFRLANLDEVVVHFRRANDFFSKRGGWGQALAEWRVRCHARRALGQSSFANTCYAVAASALRVMPAKVQAIAYRMAT
jgi:hypothetical protein